MSDIGILTHLPEQLAVIGVAIMAIVVLAIIIYKKRERNNRHSLRAALGEV